MAQRPRRDDNFIPEPRQSAWSNWHPDIPPTATGHEPPVTVTIPEPAKKPVSRASSKPAPSPSPKADKKPRHAAPAVVAAPTAPAPEASVVNIDSASPTQTNQNPLQAGAGSGPPSYRVSELVNGTAVFLGKVGNRATPEVVIAAFPASLPREGTSTEFLFQGITAMGLETGRPTTLVISGDAPDVVAARRRVIVPPVTSAPQQDDASKELLRATQHLLEEERKSIRAREEKLADAEREVRDRAIALSKADAAEKQNWWQAQMAIQAQTHTHAMEALRDQREQDRKDADAKDKREKEERLDRETRLEKLRIEDRDKDRQFQERIAAMGAASTLENTLPKIVAMAAAMGVDLKSVFARPEPAPVQSGESIAGAIATVASNISSNVADVVKVQMELAAAKDAGKPPPQKTITRMLLPPPEEKPAEKAAEKTTPAAATHAQPVVAGLPLPAVRDARIALRGLAAELRAAPEEKWQEKLIVFYMTKGNKVKAYVEAIGLKAAALEAGATEEEAVKLEAKAKEMQK